MHRPPSCRSTVDHGQLVGPLALTGSEGMNMLTQGMNLSREMEEVCPEELVEVLTGMWLLRLGGILTTFCCTRAWASSKVWGAVS